MKKNNLFVALAALAAMTDASALTRSFDGTGEAVLLPYYHAADGEATVFGVTNHSDQPKAVRVVIAEGRNGRAALSFNVYLAARDSWNGAIVGSEGFATPLLITNEESCTVPAIPANGVALQAFAFTGSRDDGLGAGGERTQQGSIELIEMGVPTGTAAQFIDAGNCEALIARFAEGAWELSPNTGIDAPSGGLTGQAQIIDVSAGVAFSTDPVVLDGFSFGPRHGRPSDFTAVRFSKPTASPQAGGFVVGDAQIGSERAADAVSLTLMSTAFEAGYLLGDTLDASTRIVVALPTRGAYLDNLPGGELPAGTAPIAPFDETSPDGPRCVDTEWQAIDLHGDAGSVGVIPLCRQVNVFELGEEAADGGDFTTGNDNGRVRIDLQPQPRSLPYALPASGGAETHYAHGLPAIVQSLTEVRNANAQPGVLASYAISHRVMRETDYDTEF